MKVVRYPLDLNQRMKTINKKNKNNFMDLYICQVNNLKKLKYRLKI